jgi:hypothetical protein
LAGDGFLMQKGSLNKNKLILISAQIGILFVAMAALVWLMVLNSRDRTVNELVARLDTSTQAMAAQLKASQVPFSASNVEPGVLIINQADGSVIIDHRNLIEAQQNLWERYKTKIIYEMQKQKRGWIEYPDKSTWALNEPRRIIRYLAIDELNWILAIEEPKPSSWDLFKEAVNPATCLMIFLIFILSSVLLWLLTERYLSVIKRQISDKLEGNLLSLSGEEKLWTKSYAQMPQVNEGTKESGIEFSIPKVESMPQPASDPILEENFQAPSSASVSNKAIDQSLVEKAKAPITPKETLKTSHQPKEKMKPLVNAAESQDLTIDEQNIKSPVLKKMLQKFREK